MSNVGTVTNELRITNENGLESPSTVRPKSNNFKSEFEDSD